MGTEILQAAFEGYNACMFAYGQTGTGKTYTMMGEPDDIGLTPRICEALFSHIDDCDPEENVTFRIEMSFLEIYNERVRDLLPRKRRRKHERYTLKVREHPKEGPYVQDLSRHVVRDHREIQALIDKGNEIRTTASTHMHERSSRSHAIVTVTFSQARFEDDLPSEIVSKVHLVDLAGRNIESVHFNWIFAQTNHIFQKMKAIVCDFVKLVSPLALPERLFSASPSDQYARYVTRQVVQSLRTVRGQIA
ncbi:kinesin-like protein [Plakobranchus ocellatus]|uniref:Kinesin-like protein n=1 Tax=Plakobranchus ocellatus TaxID=259542 RepID=A0AAV4CKY1_9GAST|nr:kinesin-like protein [Plakobranchus ocellatus]